MAAVTLTRTQIAGFTFVIGLAMVFLVALPSPYPADVRVVRQTGEALYGDSHRMRRARATGDVVRALQILREDVETVLPQMVRQLVDRFARELEPLPLSPLQVSVDTSAALGARDALIARLHDLVPLAEGRPVEGFFADASRAPEAIDAHAAEYARRVRNGQSVSAVELMRLSDAFAERGRMRARWRWLVRAFSLHSDHAAVAGELLAECVANGLLHEAIAVAEVAGLAASDDESVLRQLAQLGAWTSRPDVEIAALEQLIQQQEDAADRARLIELYTYIDEVEKALPHAMALASNAAEIAEAEAAADAALGAGFVEQGLTMLTRAAVRAPDPRPWLERLARHRLTDLQVDRAAVELERASLLDPEGVLPELEILYRRIDRPDRLVEVLQRRLSVEPGNEELWREVISLRYALRQPGLASVLESRREEALADPEAFRKQLPPELRLQAIEAQRLALSLSMSGEEGSVVADVLDRLRPFLKEPAFRQTAEFLLAQHKDDPAARKLRIELVDLERSPAEATVAAADLAASYPQDTDLVRLWIQRAGWASLPEAEITARRRLAQLEPSDHDNRLAHAELLAFVGRVEAALPVWLGLYEEAGIHSPAVPLLVDSLFALGRENAGVALLERLAKDPDATWQHRLRAADELFYRSRDERAVPLYREVLKAQPEHETASLRLAQIYVRTGKPELATQLLTRRIDRAEASGTASPLARFQLGEVLYALGEESQSVSLHATALLEMQRIDQPDYAMRSRIAVSLVRLGRRAEAAVAYRELVAANPRDMDLVLDYADLALSLGQLGKAGGLVDLAAVSQPDSRRVSLLRGEIARRRGDLAAAEQLYIDAIERLGADAALSQTLGDVRTELGDWRGALSAYERWLQLERDNPVAQRETQQAWDRVATAAVGTARIVRLGEDRVLETTAGISVELPNAMRLNARVGSGSYRGAAAALGGVGKRIDTGLFDVAMTWRRAPGEHYAAGLLTAPGAPGNAAVGGFVAAQFVDRAPFASLGLRLGINELWTDPAAAPELGGRRSTLSANVYSEFAPGWWYGGMAAIDRVDIDVPMQGGFGDWRARGEVSVGHRFWNGPAAIAPPFAVHTLPTGPSSPFVHDQQPEQPERAWLGSAWVSLQTARLFEGDDLPRLLPIAKNDDHLIFATRFDRRFAGQFGCSVAANAGFDLDGDGAIWGVDAAITWRPRRWCELTAGVSHGAALGRVQDGEVDQFRLEGVVRW
ncbi:MAG: tetratricopeptide repeat protein [Planctomycetota bacterium]